MKRAAARAARIVAFVAAHTTRAGLGRVANGKLSSWHFLEVHVTGVHVLHVPHLHVLDWQVLEPLPHNPPGGAHFVPGHVAARQMSTHVNRIL